MCLKKWWEELPNVIRCGKIQHFADSYKIAIAYVWVTGVLNMNINNNCTISELQHFVAQPLILPIEGSNIAHEHTCTHNGSKCSQIHPLRFSKCCPPHLWLTDFPFTHSVAKEEEAMADPQPKVLNLASTILPFSSTLIWWRGGRDYLSLFLPPSLSPSHTHTHTRGKSFMPSASYTPD